MQAHQGNVTRRTLAEHVDIAATVAIAASKAIAAIDEDLKAFHGMSFAGRLAWLVTGRVVVRTPIKIRARRTVGRIQTHSRRSLDRLHRWADRMNGVEGRQDAPAAAVTKHSARK